MRYVFNIEDDAEEAGSDVEGSHAWNDDGGNSGNGGDAPYDDGKGHDGHDDAADFIGNTECRIDGGADGIRLGHVADAEGGNDGKESKEETHQDAGFLVLEAVLHREHRAALHFTLRVHFAELEAEHAFREFRGQAEAGGNPHPDESAWAAGKHSRRNAHDISCADRSRQSGHQRGEGRNVAAAP